MSSAGLRVVGLLCAVLLVPAGSIALGQASRSQAAQTSGREQKLAEARRLSEEIKQMAAAGNRPAAIAACKKFLALQRELEPTEYETRDRILSFLADLYRGQDDLKSEKATRQELLTLREQAYGKQDWRTHNARLALYDVALAERLKPAERQLLEEARQLDSQASALVGEGNAGEAIKRLERTAEIRKRLLGPEHRSYLDSLNSLAVVFRYTDDRERALPLARQVATLRKKVLGATHPDYAQSIHNLAVLLGELGQLDQSEPLLAEALAIRQKSLGPKHVLCGETLAAWGQLRAKRKDFARAAELHDEASTIVKEAYGEGSIEYADSLKQLADMYYEMRKYSRAAPLYRQVAAIRQQTQGEDSRAFLDAVAELALLYADMGDKAQATPLAEGLLAASQRSFGAQSLEFAQTAEDVAHLYFKLNDDDRGNELASQVLAIRKAVLGERSADYLRTLSSWGDDYQQQGNYERAEALYREALETIKNAYGDRVPAYYQVLRRQAALRAAQDDYAAAESLLRQAESLIKASADGTRSADYRGTLVDLALLRYRQNDDVQGDDLARQMIDWTREAAGATSAELADTLDFWARFQLNRNDYVRALPLARQAVDVYRQAGGEQSLDVARGLARLAQVYRGMGDAKSALPLIEQAAEIVKRTQGETHADYAVLLDALGIVQASLGDVSRAAATLQQSIDIRRKVLGDEHLELAESLYSQAALFHALKVHNQAEPRYRQALEILEKNEPGQRDALLAEVLGSFSRFYADQGNYAQAEPLLRRAIDLDRQRSGQVNADRMAELAMLDLGQGKPDEAARWALDALHQARRQANLTAAVQSERQQLAMAAKLRDFLDTYLSAALAAKVSPETIYQEVLAWKGAVFVQQRWQRLRGRTLSDGDARQNQKLFAELEQKSRELASAARVVTVAEAADAHRKLLEGLSTEIEALQAKLAAQLPAAERPTAELKPSALAARLPAGTLLVDALEYRDFVPAARPGELPGREARVVVFLVRADKPLAVVSLGTAAALGTAVDDWRQAVREAGSGDKLPGAKLRSAVWEPLAGHAQGCTTVLVSPDGTLARFPWGALPGTKPGSYLLEDFAFATIPVAQAIEEWLAVPPAAAPSNASMLVVGNVDFGAAPGHTDSSLLAHSRSAPRSAEPAGGWKELPATVEEMKSIAGAFQRTFGQGRLQQLAGNQATESAVRKTAPDCQYLHLATHGFFSPADEPSALANFFGSILEATAVTESLDDSGEKSPVGKDTIDTSRLFRPERDISGTHPGLLSGIVLAGANAPLEPNQDDGVLTALEVGELDLGRVDLVTLSACETGLGESAGGEGLLGLQRAFQIAGARSVIASLWQVPDDATRVLMTEFCQNLWTKRLPKIEALRQAQLTVLRRYDPRSGTLRGLTVAAPRPAGAQAGGAPPLYWAAFVLSGDWR